MISYLIGKSTFVYQMSTTSLWPPPWGNPALMPLCCTLVMSVKKIHWLVLSIKAWLLIFDLGWSNSLTLEKIILVYQTSFIILIFFPISNFTVYGGLWSKFHFLLSVESVLILSRTLRWRVVLKIFVWKLDHSILRQVLSIRS